MAALAVKGISYSFFLRDAGEKNIKIKNQSSKIKIRRVGEVEEFSFDGCAYAGDQYARSPFV